MGYDFSLMRLTPQPRMLPFWATSDFDGRIEPLTSPKAIEERLLLMGFRRDGPPTEGNRWYRWTTPDGGSLTVLVGGDSIFIDTHAHWRYVLELYEQLRSDEPDLLIVDRQESMFYDAHSFGQFVSDSYAGKK